MARLTTLLFAMWLGVTVSTVVDLEKRIYGGHDCLSTERQYHVQVITTDINGDQYRCGGSLISPQWILTAGHCSIQGGTYTAYIGSNPGPPKKVGIKDPPEIFKDVGGQSHDLMLLKLLNTVDIKPVQLPDCKYSPEIGAVVQVAGHGRWKLGPKNEKLPGSSPTLQCADMKIVDYQVVGHEHRIRYSAPGVDTCPGDSGGGVVYQCQIYGVHVRGDLTACTAPAKSMDLCYKPYYEWIKETIKQPLANAASG